MKETYMITNIDNLTYEFVNNILPVDYEVDTNTNIILYRGVYAPIHKLDEDNIKDILIHNNVRYTTAVYCEECETWTTINYDYIHNRHGDYYLCGECLDDYINHEKVFRCDNCGEYYDNTYEHYYTQDDELICDDCFYNDYCICDRCGDVISNDNSYYCETHDAYYCESCYEDWHQHDENLLYGYHEFNDWHPTHTEEENDNPPAFYIGHELEIDNGDDMRDAVETITSTLNCIPMHDGSLSSSGIEIISHPLSYKYMLSKENDYRNAFDHLTNLGYKSHNTTTCGLHFHVTRPQNPTIIDRIILFMETYKEEIILLSRRNVNELNRWSRFLSDKKRNTSTKAIKSLDYIVNNKDTYDRYMALNLTNSKTIEFRFFKGTLKYETFMADFEFINNLVEFASNLEIPVEELTWTLITSKGHFLPAYIEEHNLQSTKPIIDYSKELIVDFNEKKSQAQIEVDTAIAKLLKNITNKARTKNNTAHKLQQTYEYIYCNNDLLNQFRYVVYNLENMQPLDYDRLEETLATLKNLKERVSD
jgi:hypothetical protein